MRSDHKESTEAAKKKARKKKQSPAKENQVLKNVVSLRVSDQEKRLLERLTRATSQNVSDLVREALGFWLSRRKKVAGEPRPKPAAVRRHRIPVLRADGI